MGMGEARLGLERRPWGQGSGGGGGGRGRCRLHEYERRTHRSVCAHGACEGRAGVRSRLKAHLERRGELVDGAHDSWPHGESNPTDLRRRPGHRSGAMKVWLSQVELLS